MPQLPLPTRTRLVVAALLAAWVGLLAVLLLEPTGSAPSWIIGNVSRIAATVGLPAELSAPSRVGFGLNVVAFVPVSLLGSLLLPRSTWRDWTAGCFVASFVAETLQAIFLGARSATFADVVSNTLGALGGGVLAAVLVRTLARRGSEDRADLPHRASPAEQDELPG
jgi:hypothetical protein